MHFSQITEKKPKGFITQKEKVIKKLRKNDIFTQQLA